MVVVAKSLIMSAFYVFRARGNVNGQRHLASREKMEEEEEEDGPLRIIERTELGTTARRAPSDYGEIGSDWGDERDIDSGPEAYPDTNPRPPPRAHEHDVGIWTEAPTEGNTKGNASSSSSSAPLFRSSVVGTGWVVTRWTDGQEPESWAQTEDGGWLKHNCNIRGYMERSRDHPTFARGSDLEAGRAQSSPDPSPHCYKCGTYVTCKPGVTFHCHLCNRAACRNCTRQEEFVHGDGMFSVRVCDLCPTPAACQGRVIDARDSDSCDEDPPEASLDGECTVCGKTLAGHPDIESCFYNHLIHRACIADTYGDTQYICKACKIGPICNGPPPPLAPSR